LPERNRKDYEDIPESARKAARFVWMSTVDDAMAAALSSPEVHVPGPNELSDVQRRLASG
jgi:ATP-dependent Lon protease